MLSREVHFFRTAEKFSWDYIFLEGGGGDFFRGVEFVSRGLFSCKWIIFFGMVDVLSCLMGVTIISGEGTGGAEIFEKG